MKELKVLKRNNLPTRLPLWQSVTCLLALEHYHAPEWLYGVMGLFFLLIWVASIVMLVKEKQIDLLENNKK
jgi:hypothetical protein